MTAPVRCPGCGISRPPAEAHTPEECVRVLRARVERLERALAEAVMGLRCLRGMTGTKGDRTFRINTELGRAAVAMGIKNPSYHPDEDILAALRGDDHG